MVKNRHLICDILRNFEVRFLRLTENLLFLKLYAKFTSERKTLTKYLMI